MNAKVSEVSSGGLTFVNLLLEMQPNPSDVFCCGHVTFSKTFNPIFAKYLALVGQWSAAFDGLMCLKERSTSPKVHRSSDAFSAVLGLL